jgi:GAF domain-containing protein
VYWYRACSAMRSGKWWLHVVVVVGFWVSLGIPLYQVKIRYGLLHTVTAILLLYGRAVRLSGPVTLPQVQYQYLARKSRLYRLLKLMQRRAHLTPHEILDFQREALELIVSYVRGHRADLSGTQIFANLLVEDGDDLIVVARNQEHREPGARYAKSTMLAWTAMHDGQTECMGDLVKDVPQQAEAKPYRSIMAVPVWGEEKVVGVVSIDSTRPHHFDIECQNLERYLAPYICLLAWSITRDRSMIGTQATAAKEDAR